MLCRISNPDPPPHPPYNSATREPGSQVGSGDVHLALARLALASHAAAAAATPPAEAKAAEAAAAAAAAEASARQSAAAAQALLRQALAEPARLGGWRQRADVRYNHACALALCGREEVSLGGAGGPPASL